MSMMSFFDLLVLVAGVAALAVAGGLAVRARADRRAQHREPTLLAVQVALALGLLAAAGTFVLVVAVDSSHQEWLGLPLALAPGLATTVGLAVVAATPALRRRPTAVRTASLERRGTWTTGARRAYLGPAISAAALVALLLATGLTGTADDAGALRAVSVHRGNEASTATPYPGWYYAAPLLAVTVLLLLVAVLAVRRIAALPATPDADDHRWRRAAVRAVSLVATAGLLLHLAGVLLVTGAALDSVGAGPDAALGVLGWALMASALLLGAAAIACLVSAVVAAATFRSALLTPAPLPR